jgi:acyl-CoA thioesterase I
MKRLLFGCFFSLLACAAQASTVLIFGDSLSAGYGLKAGEGWVDLLATQTKKETAGRVTVVNASVSGETTTGGAARLPDLLAIHKPSVVVIELGANDALRGQSLKLAEDNLIEMVQAAQAAKAKVLILGMRIPPNYGAQYTAQFEAMFSKVATQHKAALVPFFLEPIALKASAFQGDRIHPTAAVQAQLLAHVWPTIKKLL